MCLPVIRTYTLREPCIFNECEDRSCAPKSEYSAPRAKASMEDRRFGVLRRWPSDRWPRRLASEGIAPQAPIPPHLSSGREQWLSCANANGRLAGLRGRMDERPPFENCGRRSDSATDWRDPSRAPRSVVHALGRCHASHLSVIAQITSDRTSRRAAGA